MIIQRRPSAAELADALDAKPSGKGWRANCPAHNDKTPSFSINERNGVPLFKCWSGCTQSDVIEALRQRGLWPKPQDHKAVVTTLLDKRTLLAFVRAHENSLRRNIPTSTAAQQTYRRYQRLLYSPFSAEVVAAMHLYVEVYAADVQRGVKPSDDEDRRFRKFLPLTYAHRCPYGF